MANLATAHREIELNDEDQIRHMMQEFGEALSAKDVNRMMQCYAKDVVSFDMMPPLKLVGLDAYRKSWEMGLSMMDQIKLESHDVHLVVDEKVAFCHSLNRMSFVSEGKDMNMHLRWTGCFRKIQGKWLITHEHVSVPIEMDTDKALYNLNQ